MLKYKTRLRLISTSLMVIMVIISLYVINDNNEKVKNERLIEREAKVEVMEPIIVDKENKVSLKEVKDFVNEPLFVKKDIEEEVKGEEEEEEEEVSELDNDELSIDTNDELFIDPNFGLMCLVVEAEAGIESLEGKIAVANVILNRVANSYYPNTIESVIMQPYQFETVSNGRINKVEISEETIEAVYQATHGKEVVPKNTLFFYNSKLVSEGHSIRKRPIVKVIGRHTFAR